MSNLITSDDRKSKLSKWYKIGIAALVCLVVSPIIFMIVKGIIGLMIAAALGLVTIQLAPWFSIKLATLQLKLIGQDARENPVETRIQIQQDTEADLQKSLEEIGNFEGSLNTFKGQVNAIVRKYPNSPEKTETFRKQVETMQQILDNRKRMWQVANAHLKEFKAETSEISDLWEMANAADKMGKIAGIMKGKDPMNEFRIRIANNAVTDKMNKAMAQLSTSLLEESAMPEVHLPTLGFENAEVIKLDLKEVNRVQVNR